METVDIKTTFANNLKAVVKKRGLTYEEAAAMVKVDGEQVKPRTFKAWIYGVNEPPYSVAVIISETFGIDDLYLFGRKQCA